MLSKILYAAVAGCALASNDTTAPPTPPPTTEAPVSIGAISWSATMLTPVSAAIIAAIPDYKTKAYNAVKGSAGLGQIQIAGLEAPLEADLAVSAGRRLSEQRELTSVATIMHKLPLTGRSVAAADTARITAFMNNATLREGLRQEFETQVKTVSGANITAVQTFSITFAETGGSTSGAAPMVAGVSVALLGLVTLF